jgi:hypothetical protein
MNKMVTGGINNQVFVEGTAHAKQQSDGAV